MRCTAHFDAWLSDVLKRDVYRLTIDEVPPALPGDGDHAIGEILRKKPVFVYAKIPVSSAGQAAFLERLGFCLIDTTITFAKPIDAAQRRADGYSVRFATPDDGEPVAEVARSSFSFSRFHRDGAFSKEEADTVKAEWARNYFRGKRGDAMIVAEREDAVAGFLQLLCDRETGTVTVDLVAVDPRFRRRGCAARMMQYAQRELKGFETIAVGTQLANAPSLRLYEGTGFRISEAHYVFHYHNREG